MAYNIQKIEFLDGTQYRIYQTPVTEKQFMYGEKSVIESNRIDDKIKRHVWTPYGDFATEVDNIEVMSMEEIIARRRRSISNSTNRAKSMVYNYARANEWEYFITMTFDKVKIDRYNYDACSKAIRKWLNNIRNNYAPNLKYIIVPEQHLLRDGDTQRAWHFHGLISNVGNMKFTRALNHHTKEELFTKSGLPIYNMKNYKLGWCTATPIRDSAKASGYITKYITKELTMHTKGFRRYYPSSNLELPKRTYYFLQDNEILEFLRKREKRITYRKQVAIKVSNYEQITTYLEVCKAKGD